ncbi:MAG TPA: transporter substrate-binding domain-containing protein, partial [Opitutus sp.]|nr:transporter substrate-binding domain-containing protein [Opitutus sp.]
MRRSPAVVYFLLLAFLAVAALSRAETLRLRADSWMPYNGDPTSELPGYAIEIARAILGPRNITLDYDNMSWGDALKAAAAGEIEAVIGANRQEAVGLIVPENPIGLPRIGLFAHKDNTSRYDNVPGLQKYKLGVILDYKYWDALDAYIEKNDAPQVIKFSGEQPLEDAMVKLNAGEFDLLAETSS